MLCSVLYLGFVSIPESYSCFFFLNYHYPHCVHEKKIIYKFLIRAYQQELLRAKESPKNVSNKFTHCPQEKQANKQNKNPKQNQLNTTQTQKLSVNLLYFSLLVYKPEKCKSPVLQTGPCQVHF